MDVTVRVEGAAKLRRALRRAGVELDELKDAHARVAALVAQLSIPRAPRRTGRLAASTRGNRAAGRARVSAGGAALPYGPPIHWGWPARGIKAQPWLAATAADSEAQWLSEYEQDLARIISTVERTST